ncbi:MAG: ABC transporter ATP-binding protein [Verrucomicrobiota bacterium]
MSWSVQIEGLHKRYRRGGVPVMSNSLREDAGRFLKSLKKRQAKEAADPAANSELPPNHFWALRDINLEINQGDIVGLIGFNGSGKSTLLKIIARITEPTKGNIRYRGRLGTMLEVGTGFHRELSGRENIYLNGAILGMTRRDITAAFDEIVEFSEVGSSLDTPVKFYSSGMYVRLAFSVAAHLRTDILLVDEVLAVGDQRFQDKCLGKMDDVAAHGKTIIFVSHNMASVEKLCRRGILLREGTITCDGEINEAIRGYLNIGGNLSNDLSNHPNREGSGEVRVDEIEIIDQKGYRLNEVPAGESVRIRFHFRKTTDAPIDQIDFGIKLLNEDRVPVFFHRNTLDKVDFGKLPNRGTFECSIDRLPLPIGRYFLNYHLSPDFGRTAQFYDKIVSAYEFSVVSGAFFESGQLPPRGRGVALLNADWQMLPQE